jgi:hypothetical protein
MQMMRRFSAKLQLKIISIDMNRIHEGTLLSMCAAMGEPLKSQIK